ncbi:hypothetical protein SF434370_2084 [Shigella flexneri 4343-70]|nr:hypothetical protein SF434370_2084 [Shigella flexneri 4343-70]
MLKGSLKRQLNENKRYWQELEVAQGDWKNGAMRAFQNFTADADNAAERQNRCLQWHSAVPVMHWRHSVPPVS